MIKLPYVEGGDATGVPVVMLHGVTDSWRSFELVLSHLPDDIRGRRGRLQPVLRSPAAIPLTVRRSARASSGSGSRPASWSARLRSVSATWR
jgi:hypothetical protein